MLLCWWVVRLEWRAAAHGVRVVEIEVASMRSLALSVREVSVEAIHRDGHDTLMPQGFDDLIHHAGLP